MANSSNPFMSWGSKLFSGVPGGAIAVCRFVGLSGGKLIACANGERPIGVSPVAIGASDPSASYYRYGECNVETDGSAAVDTYVKAAADGSGKAILDSSPGFATAGRVRSLDAATNIARVLLEI